MEITRGDLIYHIKSTKYVKSFGLHKDGVLNFSYNLKSISIPNMQFTMIGVKLSE